MHDKVKIVANTLLRTARRSLKALSTPLSLDSRAQKIHINGHEAKCHDPHTFTNEINSNNMGNGKNHIHNHTPLNAYSMNLNNNNNGQNDIDNNNNKSSNISNYHHVNGNDNDINSSHNIDNNQNIDSIHNINNIHNGRKINNSNNNDNSHIMKYECRSSGWNWVESCDNEMVINHKGCMGGRGADSGTGTGTGGGGGMGVMGRVPPVPRSLSILSDTIMSAVGSCCTSTSVQSQNSQTLLGAIDEGLELLRDKYNYPFSR